MLHAHLSCSPTNSHSSQMKITSIRFHSFSTLRYILPNTVEAVSSRKKKKNNSSSLQSIHKSRTNSSETTRFRKQTRFLCPLLSIEFPKNRNIIISNPSNTPQNFIIPLVGIVRICSCVFVFVFPPFHRGRLPPLPFPRKTNPIG